MKTRLSSVIAWIAWIGAPLALPAQGAPPEPPPAKKPPAEQDAQPDKPHPKDPGEGHGKPKVERPEEKRTFLGVVISPVSQPLADHLGLPEGFGLQVDHVMKDSPGALADIQEHDILTKFDDQLLTTPEHLALLVKSKKAGTNVQLTLIRRGKEQTVATVLQEKSFPVEEPPGHGGPGWGKAYGFERMPEEIRKHLDEAVRHMPWQGFPGGEMPPGFNPPGRGTPPMNHPRPNEPEAKQPKKPQSPHSPEQPGKPSESPKPSQSPEKPASADKPPQISVRPGFPVSVFAAASMVQINNPEGSVSISSKDGKHSITIKNKTNETIYDGDYDPAKGSQGLPEKAQETLKEMKLDDLKVIVPPTPDGPPAAKGEGISSPRPSTPKRSTELF